MKNLLSTIDLNNLGIEEIDISFEEQFDLSSSVQNAQEFLNEYNDYDINYRKTDETVFESDFWSFYNELLQTNHNLDFSVLKKSFNFSDKELSKNIISIAKCWIVNLINETSPLTASKYFHYFSKIVLDTKGFHPSSMDSFIEDLNNRIFSNKAITEHVVHAISTTIKIFNEYYFHPLIEGYSDELENVRKPNIEKNHRILPPSKEIYTFTHYLNKWFEDSLKRNENDLIYFYPIYLWWNIGTIIPIRPSEFANLERNCTFKNKGKFYIKLPRTKQKGKNRKKIQVIDELAITESIYNLIQDYIGLTNPFGETKTLVSYMSIRKCNILNNNAISKIDKTKMNSRILRNILGNFYTKVLFDKFHLTVVPKEDSSNEIYDFSRKLTLNDARHIAITSMMLQGYDKIEIARLAGHTSLDTQYSYYDHLQFWVDSEVKRLSDDFHLNQTLNLDEQKNYSYDGFNLLKTIGLNSWSVHKSELLYKLNLGYCSDSEMSCPKGTRNDFTGCYHCPFWRIEYQEFNANKHLIKDELNVSNNHLNNLVKHLITLHKHSNLNEVKEINPDLKSDIKRTSNAIQDLIVSNAELHTLYEILK